MVFTSPFSLSWLSEFLVHVHQNFQVDLDSFPNIGYVYSNNASLTFLSRIPYIYKLIFLSLVCIVCCSFFQSYKKAQKKWTSGLPICGVMLWSSGSLWREKFHLETCHLWKLAWRLVKPFISESDENQDSSCVNVNAWAVSMS